MSVKDLKSFDPELLLQELRARESREADEKEMRESFPCGRVPSAKVSIGGVVETVPELEAYATEDIVVALRGQQKVIYGTDDRDDMYDVTDPRILTDADSVVALVNTSDITDNGDITLHNPYVVEEYEQFQLQRERMSKSVLHISDGTEQIQIPAYKIVKVEEISIDRMKTARASIFWAYTVLVAGLIFNAQL